MQSGLALYKYSTAEGISIQDPNKSNQILIKNNLHKDKKEDDENTSNKG